MALTHAQKPPFWQWLQHVALSHVHWFSNPDACDCDQFNFPACSNSYMRVNGPFPMTCELTSYLVIDRLDVLQHLQQSWQSYYWYCTELSWLICYVNQLSVVRINIILSGYHAQLVELCELRQPAFKSWSARLVCACFFLCSAELRQPCTVKECTWWILSLPSCASACQQQLSRI